MGRGQVLASAEPGSRRSDGGGKDLPFLTKAVDLSVQIDRHLITQAIDLIPIVRDEEGSPVKAVDGLTHHLLHLPAQRGIQS